MATTLTYNGHALSNVKITSYADEPILAEDERTVEMHHHVLRGTSIVADVAANFAASMETARSKLLKPQADMTLSVDGQTIFSPTAPDMHGGPRGTFTIAEGAVYGARSAIITFEIEWWEVEPDGSNVLHNTGVLSHQWTAECKTDEIGHTRLTVRGSLRVRGNASDTESGQVNTGRNPDAYRLLVTPDIPAGFRAVERTYALDATGNRLLYEVVYQEFARNLPHPARVGNARFTYQRALGESPSKALGIKSFECELESNRHFSPGALIDAAMKVAATRIRFGVDRLIEYGLSEEDMFTSNKIRMWWRATDKSGVEGGGRLLPTTVRIGDNWSEGIEGYRDINVYGAALLRNLRGNFFAPINASATATINQAETEGQQGNIFSHVPTNAYTFPPAVYDSIKDRVLTGPASTAQDNGYVSVEAVERIRERTNVVVLPSSALAGADLAFQMRRPDVILESELTVVRRGTPPSRSILAPPPRSIVLEQSVGVTDVETGGDGSRLYTARHHRICQLLDSGENQNGWKTDPSRTTPGRSFRSWSPPSGLELPYDPRVRQDSPNSVLAPRGDRFPAPFDLLDTP